MKSIFTRIIEREIPAYIVYEDDLVIAFLDISQATKGHTLVVPKKVYENLYEMPDELASHVMKISIKLAKAIQKAFKPAGLNLLNNNGEIAGQSVFHFHMHLIPRYENDGVSMRFSNHMNDLNPEDYKNRAKEITSAL
ncbi:MAG: HIT family protein [Acholeplasmataceae bacterium]|nr:HIT family protein [Acholeplasmataceae bacterium]MDD4193826.1 HIT family protein [Acholeplasmataceae bacterium]